MMNEQRSDSRRRIRTAIFCGTFLACIGLGMISFTIPLITLDQRMSLTWLGSAFAGYYLARLLAAPLAGIVADRFGIRRILISTLTAGSLIPLFYFLSPTVPTLYIIQFCIGMVAGTIRPVGMAALGSMTASTSPAKHFAAYASLFSAAAFVGPIFGSVLYTNKSEGPVLGGLSLCMALAAVTTFVLLPRGPFGATTEPPSSSASTDKRHTIAGLFSAICGRTMGLGFLAAFYPIILATIVGRNGFLISILFALPGAATFLGLILTNRFSSRSPGLTQVISGLLISAGSLFLLAECTSAWQFAIMGMTMGLGAARSMPASMALASKSTDRQGGVFGAATMAAGFGFLMGPLLGGLLVQHFHSLLPALQIMGLLGAISTIPIGAVALRERLHLRTGMAYALSGTLAGVILLVAGVRMAYEVEAFSGDVRLHRFTDVAMGTVVQLTLEDNDKEKAAIAARRTIAAIRGIQQDFDFRNPGGSVGRINAHAGQSWVKPSDRAFALLKRAFAISQLSNGVFDPTIGALTNMPLYYALDPTIAHEKADLVDYRQLLFDEHGKRVRLNREGMALDLGGIAKGTIVDMAVSLLREYGIRAGIVEAGGDFYCFGQRDWTVGIRHPRNDSVYQTVTIREQGVCGSGDYQQFITTETAEEVTTQHHIINPSTMESATESIGVTVIADTAETADALATTLFIMGPVAGSEFLETNFSNSASIWFLPNGSASKTRNFPN